MFHRMLIKKSHRYKALLISLIVFVFLSPMLPEGRMGAVQFGGLFLLVIFFASYNLLNQVIARWSMPILGILSLIFGALIQYGMAFALVSRVMMFLFFCTAIGVFARDVFNERHPRGDHLYGAITIYFLLGITYALAYQFVQLLNPQALITADTGLPVINPFDMYYFSFITLSTVGYGDVIAHSQLAKVVCMLESMTGLFYIAILVSSLIEIFQSSKQ